MSTPTDLAKRLNVRETIREFHAACDRVRVGFSIVQEAKDRLDTAFLLGGERISPFSIQEPYGREPHWDRPEDTIAELEKQAWRVIVQRLELRQFLSVRRWGELQKDLDGGKMPPLTEESALQLLQSFAGQLDELIAEAVREVYDFLRPSRSEKKTNSQWRVGKRVILEGYLSVRSLPKYRVDYDHRSQRITALENVFTSLNGKGQITKGYKSNLEAAIEASEDGRGETEYFRFKCFRNRNLHLEFTRDDLLFRLNQIAGRWSLAA